jgi:ribonuclease D
MGVLAAFGSAVKRGMRSTLFSIRPKKPSTHRDSPPPPASSNLDAITFIHTTEGLAELIEHLRPHHRIALDTEADNLHHYETRVCLLQIDAGTGRQFLVDTLAGLELAPLFDALAPKFLIMHGSDYDLRLLWELTKFRPKEVFDTMLAAQLLGRARIGLSSLLQEILGLHHPKDSQKSDWSKRPLPEKMVRYAAGDVAHMAALHRALAAELKQLGRDEWHRQKCAWQIEVATAGFPPDNDNAWRLGPSRHCSPRALAALYELWHWRESEAKRLDRPPFKIMSNDYLMKLSLAVSEGTHEAAFEKLPEGLRRGRARGLPEALRRGAERDPKTLPRRPPSGDRLPPLTGLELARQDVIRDHRDRVAAELKIDPTLIASRSQIALLARAPQDAGQLLLSWQVELLREALEQFTRE